MYSKNTKKQWSLQEIELFKQLYSLFGQKKWKKISKQFKKRGFRRTQLQIRSKWINSLDPLLSNKDWSRQQLQKIYELYDKIGSKWSLIKRQLPGRTQNKIKNKFYGNLRIFIRYVEYYFNGKNCKQTKQINKISPNILNFIYRSQEDFNFLNGEIPEAMKQMNYCIKKFKIHQRILQNKQIYEELHLKINQIFQDMKNNQEIKKLYQGSESDSLEEEQFVVHLKKQKTAKQHTAKTPKTTQSIKIEQENINIKQIGQAKIQSAKVEQPQSNNYWSSVITIQPRNNISNSSTVISNNEDISMRLNSPFMYFVYFPWQL